MYVLYPEHLTVGVTEDDTTLLRCGDAPDEELECRYHGEILACATAYGELVRLSVPERARRSLGRWEWLEDDALVEVEGEGSYPLSELLVRLLALET